MKKFLFCLVTFCLTNTSQAQFVKNDWGAVIGNPVNDTANGLSELTINGMEADASGNTIVIGTFKGTIDFDPSAGTVNINSAEPFTGVFLMSGFFAKYNSNGTLVWVKTLGSSAANLYMSALALDETGSIYLAGTNSSGGTGSGGIFDLDPNAGVVNTDPNSTNFWAKYDSNGNFIWGDGFNNLFNYRTSQLLINANNELVVMGASQNSLGIGSFVFLNKTNGVTISGYNLAGDGSIWDNTQYQNKFQAKQDASGNYLVCGYLSGAMDVDPGPGVTNLISNSSLNFNAELFVCKYNSAMNLQWAFVLNVDVFDFSAPGGAFPSGITTDASDNVYIAGVYKDTIDFDPGAGQTILLPTNIGIGLERGFISKYSPSGNLIWARPIDENSASPAIQRSIISDLKLNPFDNTLYVHGRCVDYPKDLLINEGTLIIPAFSYPAGNNANSYSFISNLDLNGNTLNLNTVVPGEYEGSDVSATLSIENNGVVHICSSSFIQNNTIYNPLSFGACENNPVPYPNSDAGFLGFAISRFSPCTNPPQISSQPQDTTGCLGFPLTVNVGVTGATCTKYFWMKINTNNNSFIPGFWEVVQDSSVLYFPSFSVADTGTYICTIEGECGSISTNVFTIGGPRNPVVDFGFFPDVTQCVGTPYTFDLSPYQQQFGDAPYSFQWKKGNAVLSNAASFTIPSLTTSNSGTYFGIVTNLCNSDTLVVNLTVNATSSQTLQDIICIGSTYTLPDGTTTDSSGTYSFQYTTSSGCDSIYSLILTEEICAGLTNSAIVGFEIYPNPSSGILHINNTPKGSRIKLINTLGQVLVKMDSDDAQTSLDMSRFANGLYTIILESDGGMVTRKVLIEK